MSISILKDRIERMSKYHQIEVLRILRSKEECVINENNNGTFINLTEQSSEVIDALEQYANYVDEQQQRLTTVENEKDKIEQTFFMN
jgi:hypothetical protein